MLAQEYIFITFRMYVVADVGFWAPIRPVDHSESLSIDPRPDLWSNLVTPDA